MPTSIARLLTVLIATVLGGTACTTAQKGSTMNRTMTSSQAGVRAGDLIREALSVLPPTARLELLSSNTYRCEDTPGKITVGPIYWIRDMPKEKTPEYFDAVMKYWTDHNFTITTDARPKVNSIAAKSPDGFGTSLREGDPGDLSISASSPCVWPTGVPPTTTG